jgi:hypothetical protein
VFIPGLIRTDCAFIDKVVATVRPWRQYVRSLNRLYAMEREAKKPKLEKAPNDIPDPVVMPPLIEWWVENFSLISDIVTRRYPFYMVAYESVLKDPDKTLRDVFRWLGEGDVEAAIARVDPALRTQSEEVEDHADGSGLELEPQVIEVFDAQLEMVRTQAPHQQAFVDRLNETNELLGTRIEAAVKETARGQFERKRLLEARRKKEGGAGYLEPPIRVELMTYGLRKRLLYLAQPIGLAQRLVMGMVMRWKRTQMSRRSVRAGSLTWWPKVWRRESLLVQCRRRATALDRSRSHS